MLWLGDFILKIIKRLLNLRLTKFSRMRDDNNELTNGQRVIKLRQPEFDKLQLKKIATLGKVKFKNSNYGHGWTRRSKKKEGEMWMDKPAQLKNSSSLNGSFKLFSHRRRTIYLFLPQRRSSSDHSHFVQGFHSTIQSRSNRRSHSSFDCRRIYSGFERKRKCDQRYNLVLVYTHSQYYGGQIMASGTMSNLTRVFNGGVSNGDVNGGAGKGDVSGGVMAGFIGTVNYIQL